ncbi:MAG: P-loop NTPase [Bdellovibrionales bacterium]|nr:P-loop NTPase [Bdellovibrionales bacterium]
MKQSDTKQPEYLHIRGEKKPRAHIIAVGGGKGGVGKSFVSSSMAIFLSQMGYKTVLADLDFGAANIHTYLSMGVPSVGLHQFFQKPLMKLAEVQIPTGFKNLSLITCANDSMDVDQVTDKDRSRLMSSLYQLEADFIILDLSAGATASTLDFFLMATQQIVVLTPEPVSVENAYRFIKSAFFRKIKRYEHQLNLEKVLNEIMEKKDELNIRSPGDLLHYLSKHEPERGAQLSELMNQFQINLVLNQGRSQKDLELAPSIKSVCKKYFGISCELLGQIEHDNAVWQSLRRRKHLLVDCPQSRLYTQLMYISRSLMKVKNKKAVV